MTSTINEQQFKKEIYDAIITSRPGWQPFVQAPDDSGCFCAICGQTLTPIKTETGAYVATCPNQENADHDDFRALQEQQILIEQSMKIKHNVEKSIKEKGLFVYKRLYEQQKVVRDAKNAAFDAIVNNLPELN